MKKLLITGSIIASILLGGCASKSKQQQYVEKVKANPIEAVKKSPHSINFIDNPSEELQLIAVKKDPSSIRVIKNPTESVQLEAVKQVPNLIHSIENPTESVQLEAVRGNITSLWLIKNPTESVQLEAVKIDPIRAVSFNPHLAKYIKNPSKDMIIKLIDANPKAISMIDGVSEDIKLEAVKKSYMSIMYMAKPSDAIKLEASKQIKPFYSRYKIKDYKAEDKFIKIEVLDDSNYKIHNKTNQFININILSFYYGDKVQTISNIAIPPQAHNTLSFPYESVNLSKTKENFGFAVEYNINDKKHNLFKVNQYYLSDFLFNVF